MSAVAVKKEKGKITIGADSILVSGYTQEKDTKAKLFRSTPDFIFGASGMAADGELLNIFAKTHKPKAATEEAIIDFFNEFLGYLRGTMGSPAINLDNTNYLIVFKRRIFFFHNFYIREIKDYYAIGAGRDFALAALYLGQSVRKALEAACHLSVYCEKPITIFEL